MASKGFTRLYHKKMASALKPIGFKRKGTVYYREINGLLHIIALNRSSFDGAFTVDVAVQPLVYPSDNIIVGLGGRLNRFGKGITPRWQIPTDNQELLNLLVKFTEIVIENAVPWLDRFQSVRNIVEIQKNNSWGILPLASNCSRKEYTALCALDAEMFNYGKNLLNQVIKDYYSDLETSYKETGIDVPDWAIKRKKRYEELVGLLNSGDLIELRRRLDEFKNYTRSALGISR